MDIAVLQMRALAGNAAANLARIERAAGAAADRGAGLLVAPELAVNGYGAAAALERIDAGEAHGHLERLSAIAGRHGLAIVAGLALPEPSDRPAAGGLANAAAFVTGDAPPVVYCKSHLYGDYERAHFAAADPATVIVAHGGLRIGILICFDVEFPENVRRLARAGADLVAVPTALPAGPDAATIARQLVPVRAFENQIFLAYANHCGADAHFSYAGLSVVAAPDGTALAAAPAEGEMLLVAPVEPSRFAQSRARNPYLDQVRHAPGR